MEPKVCLILLASIGTAHALHVQYYSPGEDRSPISCAHPSEYRDGVEADLDNRQYSNDVQWQVNFKDSNRENDYTFIARNGCLKQFTDIHFSLANQTPELFMDIMARLRAGRPFSWVRIGDVEMMNLKREDEVSRMMAESFSRLSPADDNLFVAPGVWWLCQERLYFEFNRFLKLHPTQYVFVDGFYLPLGDDSENPDWRKEGVEGFLQASNGKPIVFVGPARFRDICFIKFADFVEVGHVNSATQVNDIKTNIKKVSQDHPDQNVVFLVAAGSVAKIIGIDGLKEFPKDTFIDIGKMFDQFTCVKSPRIRSIAEMCQISAPRMIQNCCSPDNPALRVPFIKMFTGNSSQAAIDDSKGAPRFDDHLNRYVGREWWH